MDCVFNGWEAVSRVIIILVDHLARKATLL